MRVFYSREPEHGGQGPLRRFDEASGAGFPTRKKRRALSRRRFRMWQHVQGPQYLSRELHPNHAAIFDGTFLQMIALNVLLGERDDVANSGSCVPQQEDQGARAAARNWSVR